MPLDQWKNAIDNARITSDEHAPRAFMPLELSQAHMLRRVARCLCDLDPNEGDALGQVRPRQSDDKDLPVKKVGRTIKLANTVDQGDDTEVAAMSIADA
eukprot:1090512-Amphidinium_carterae.1